MDELLNGRLYLGSVLGMEALAYNEMKLPVASGASLLKGTVSVVDGLFYIETVQIDLVGLTVLLQDGFKNTTAIALVGTLLFSGTRISLRNQKRVWMHRPLKMYSLACLLSSCMRLWCCLPLFERSFARAPSPREYAMWLPSKHLAMASPSSMAWLRRSA